MLDIANFIIVTIAAIAAIWSAVQSRRLEVDLKRIETRITGRTQLLNRARETVVPMLHVIETMKYKLKLEGGKLTEGTQYDAWMDFRLGAIELQAITPALNDEHLTTTVSEFLKIDPKLGFSRFSHKETLTPEAKLEQHRRLLFKILERIYELTLTINVE